MRLLNIHTFEFAEFEGDDLPPYKITSHRWTNDELTWRDVLKNKRLDSKGYIKVRGFCQFIIDDNERLRQHIDNDLSAWEWIWIDTACIDNRSSAEVSASINSMFSWYAWALECIAYLPDVPSLRLGEDAVMVAFRESEWFTRGWTLQELLVPRMVIFVNEDWVVIGHKCAYCNYSNPCMGTGPLLNNVVAEITGIAQEILFDYQESAELRAEDKMDWMVKRTTTKVEDMAYCMLGIFDVNMHLRYGEGGANAMERLERKIAGKETTTKTLPVANVNLRLRIAQTEEQIKQRMDDVRSWTLRPPSEAEQCPSFASKKARCIYCRRSYHRQADLRAHMLRVHHAGKVQMNDCEVPSCHRRGMYGFARKDQMRKHVERVHRSRSQSPSRTSDSPPGDPQPV